MAEKVVATDDVEDILLDTEEEPPRRRPGKGRMVIAAITLLLMTLGGSLGLYLSGGAGAILDSATGGSQGTTGAGEMQRYSGASYKMDDIIVNIVGRTESGRKINRFLKIGITLVHDPSDGGLVERRQAYLRDTFQAYLRQLHQDEVAGSIGLAKLKADLLHRSSAIFGRDVVKEVLITELLVQ